MKPKKSRLENSKTKLPAAGMSGQEALTRLVGLFKGQNLGMAAGWLQQMGTETIDYAHERCEKIVNNQQQRMIGAVEMLSAMQVIDDTTTDTACGLILRLG